jgi:deoxycytidylate deaminase
MSDYLNDMPTFFRLAKNSLHMSNCKIKVSAVIAKKRPYIVSVNKQISHPIYVTGLDFRTSIHAEVNACIHLTDKKCDGANIFVYREAKTSPTGVYIPALAKPCKHCMAILLEKGIKKVFYSVPFYPYWEVIRL